jgi:hypothetical protein
MTDDQLTRELLALAQTVTQNAQSQQQQDACMVLLALADALRKKKDLSPFARNARSYAAGCPHTEVA